MIVDGYRSFIKAQTKGSNIWPSWPNLDKYVLSNEY